MNVTTVKQLKLLVRSLIAEATDAPLQAGDSTQLQNASIDAEIDRLLLQSDKQQQNSQLESILREDDNEANESQTQIDAVSFADGVARLIEKFNSLIDIRGTVVRRALNYVSKNYDKQQSQTVQQILAGNFGLEAIDNPSNDDGLSDKTPAAKGAGPTGNGE